MIPDKLKPSCCWLTGEELFEVISVFPHDHKLAGHPLKMGKVLPGACRARLLLMDGTNTSVNLHESVADSLRDRLIELWNNMRARYNFQIQHPDVFYAKATEGQMRQIRKTNVTKIDNNPPIDVLDFESWQSIITKRERASL